MQNQVRALYAYLCVKNASEAIQFYSAAFGATERFRLEEPGGRIGHAEIALGEGIVVMLSDEYPECGILAPDRERGTPVTIHLQVDNADEWIGRAVAAGATLERAAKDEFYGDRSGCIRDPFGHRWNIAHSFETVTPEEMQTRYTALLREGES